MRQADKDKARDILTITETVERWLTSEDVTREELAKKLHGANRLLKELLECHYG
jgi:hypothetical protein